MAPGAGREIGTAHAASGRHAVAEHALLPEQHGALGHGAGIGGDVAAARSLRRRDLSPERKGDADDQESNGK